MASHQWEELRKQARHLENEIDVKLVSFSKLGTSLGSRDFSQENGDTVPLLSTSATDHMFESMAEEIQRLLDRLRAVNVSLSEMNVNGAVMSHTLQRHRDILNDFNAEFEKTRSNIEARRQREELLGNVKSDVDRYKSGINRRSEIYLKENEHLRNSERLVNDQINIAIRTKEELRGQRHSFKSIQTRMTTLASRFPAINSLIQRINVRKRRDTIILGVVIGLCTTVILFYMIH